jgi:hypothetical protein
VDIYRSRVTYILEAPDGTEQLIPYQCEKSLTIC